MKLPTRVLVVTPPMSNRGGVAHYYRALREHLGPEIEYFTRGGGGDGTSVSGVFRLWNDVRRFERELRNGDPGIVLLNPSFGYKSLLRDRYFLLRAKRAKKPVIVFFRGWNSKCERFVRRYLLSWFRSTFFQANLVIVLSSAFERSLREMGFEGPVIVETTVVPDSVFDSVQARAKEPTSSGERHACNVLFLSRIERDKGVYHVIETHRILLKQHPRVTLTIAGTGSELARAKQFARRERIPGVRFLGYVEDQAKEAAYRDADIFYFPSFYGEGMPNAVLEAMAYGVPVVTRPVGGLGDFFENEKMGFVSDSRDPAEFAELIGALVVDERRRREMGGFNRSYAERRFKASGVAKRLYDIYDRLV